jgi:hypothetical protein
MSDVTTNALMVTGFVGMMMLVIEYLNVLTSGVWRQGVATRHWGQYLLAGFLGATPGCLGAFAVVAMYSHGVLTLGAVVATMIATSGDEAFAMLAMIPNQALLIAAVLFLVGVAVGGLLDWVASKPKTRTPVVCEGLEIHAKEQCTCFSRSQILAQWKECSAARGVLVGVLMLFLAGVAAGQLGPPVWDWIRVSLVAVSALALFIVGTVPDHFLERHLWEHVARKHVPRVFAWTFGALAAVHFLSKVVDLDDAVQGGKWIVLLVACLVGLIPESGPHLIFVTLYAQGAIPLSILLASCIVQDGHGMLPLLAHSRSDFLAVKAINFGAGLAVGAAAMGFGI